jgi:inhibitor of cysteine peptidase
MPAARVDVEEGASGTEVALRPGGRLRVALEENPSTGYLWRRVRAGEPVLALREDAYQPPADPRPGAPGRRILVLEAVASGPAEVALEYARAWEQGSPSRRFVLAVRVLATRSGRRPSSASGRRPCRTPRHRRRPG